MLSLNKCLMLNTKTYEVMFVIAKKKYIALKDGEIIHCGITKNGPPLWNEILSNLAKDYLVNEKSITSHDIIQILYKIYSTTYEKLKTNKEAVLCKMNIRPIQEYLTDTPAKKLMQRIKLENSDYEFSKSIKYFHLFKNNPRTLVFALDYELEGTPIHMINLYKFYSAITKTMYMILAEDINRTNVKRNVYFPYTNSAFANDNLVAFVLAHNSIRQNYAI